MNSENVQTFKKRGHMRIKIANIKLRRHMRLKIANIKRRSHTGLINNSKHKEEKPHET